MEWNSLGNCFSWSPRNTKVTTEPEPENPKAKCFNASLKTRKWARPVDVFNPSLKTRKWGKSGDTNSSVNYSYLSLKTRKRANPVEWNSLGNCFSWSPRNTKVTTEPEPENPKAKCFNPSLKTRKRASPVEWNSLDNCFSWSPRNTKVTTEPEAENPKEKCFNPSLKTRKWPQSLSRKTQKRSVLTRAEKQ